MFCMCEYMDVAKFICYQNTYETLIRLHAYTYTWPDVTSNTQPKPRLAKS